MDWNELQIGRGREAAVVRPRWKGGARDVFARTAVAGECVSRRSLEGQVVGGVDEARQ